VRGDAEKMHDTSLDLDDEEHVVATEQDSVDGQEVGCDDDLGLSAEEISPTWTRSAWRGTEPAATQDVGHARFRDRDAKLLELANNARVACGCRELRPTSS
jgi:hypothetical protein